jgi:hypothetical protein
MKKISRVERAGYPVLLEKDKESPKLNTKPLEYMLGPTVSMLSDIGYFIANEMEWKL